ncbi:MAG: hypothetical protein LBH52_01750 [Puniceicoccales bacterium]|jgi:hypothetical protein|nr:hypothetical protein [Puniceicoccales bacterium]
MNALNMVLRKIYVLIALFFLIPFVHALPPNFKDLCTRTRAVIAQFESDSSKAQVVRILTANVGKLLDQAKQKSAVTAIQATLNKLPPSAKDGYVETLIDDLLDAIKFLKNLPSETLQRRAHEYFSRIFPGSEITFSDKPQKAGAQFGKIARISFPGYPEPILYHIKTHQRGSTSSGGGSKGSARGPVNLIELFVYRFLQYSGLGPEVHFFWDDETNFYIATKDVGYTETGAATIYSYDTVKSTPALLGINCSNFDPSIDNPINPKVMEGFVLIDIISRIFNLTDILTNCGNFFFIVDASDSISDLKIIDFVVLDTMIQKNLFKEFTDGTEDSHRPHTPIKQYILTKRAPNARIEEAKRVFTPMVGNIFQAIQRAFDDVVHLSKQIPLDIDSLARYREFVEANVHAFAEGLRFGTLPERADTIQGMNFRLRDVPHDGNCGVWAVLLAIHPEMAFNEETEAVMLNLRRRAAEEMPAPGQDVVPLTHEPTGDAYTTAPNYDLPRERAILATPGRFIGPEHLLFIGQIPDVNVRIVIYDAYDAYHGQFLNIEGRVIQVEDAIANVRTGGILLYYDEHFRHFQVMVPKEVPEK